MSRVVYIGGFGNGQHSAEKVALALEPYFEEPVPFTFSEYVNNSHEVRKALQGADLVTHSAGALAISEENDFWPNYSYLFNAPIPTTVPKLVWGAVKKTARMHTPGVGLHKLSDVPEVVSYSGSALADIAAHPIANFGSLKKISQFDVVASAIGAKNRSVGSQVVWTSHDSFYQPNAEDLNSLNLSNISYEILDGEHDELPLRPEALLAQVFES